MSAQRAFGNATDANPFPATAHVRIPGSKRTYEVRDVLRGLGLRWYPLSHAWHGMLPGDQSSLLARDFRLKPQIVPTIETFASGGGPERASDSPERPEGSRSPVLAARPRDGLQKDPSGSSHPRPSGPWTRTRAEARLALPGADDDHDEVEVGERRFSLLEVTSGLPDDSRDEDERAEYRHLVDLRSRVKIARAVVSKMPGLAAMLRERPDRATRFYARFGITEGQFREGVRSDLSMQNTGRPD